MAANLIFWLSPAPIDRYAVHSAATDRDRQLSRSPLPTLTSKSQFGAIASILQRKMTAVPGLVHSRSL